jgi:CPA2 family monovalent cation:H+ antiporter-2
MIDVARMLNPGIEIVVRSHSDEEAELLRTEASVQVYIGEEQLAASMTRHIQGHLAKR